MTVPAPPKGLGPAGRRLWRSVCAEFELSGGDAEVLRHACVTADQLEALEPMRRLGPFMKSADGQPKVNPAYVEHRHQSLVLTRLLASIQVIGEVAGEEH